MTALRTLYVETNDPRPGVDQWKPLSYIVDWRDAFLEHPGLKVEICNPLDPLQYADSLRHLRDYDLIVISHAATGDDMSALLKSAAAYNARRAPMAVFIGNEYDIMGEKIAFIRETGAEYVCTQLPLRAAQWLYEDCLSARLLALPHGLNPKRFCLLPGVQRSFDIGFKGDIYYPWVGDLERTHLIEHFETRGELYLLSCDIRRERVDGDDWCRFLNGCKGIIGAESGTYYLNGRGDVLRQAKAHMAAHPATGFPELHGRFFAPITEPVSGKAISSRHFEPMGTGTCQLLLEGEYNGLLEPDVHYIPIRRDLSDVLEAVYKFKDETYRQRIADQAREHALTRHTYAHRVSEFLQAIGAA